MNENLEFKVVVIGDLYVGKTSILGRLYKNAFHANEESTIAASYIQFPLVVKEKPIKLNIWDTAGHEKFQCVVPLYARSAEAVIIVFDVSNDATLNAAKKWYNDLKDEVGIIPVSFLCANKIDLVNNPDLTDSKKWADENNVYFEKTSAATGENINQLFYRVSEKILENYEEKKKIQSIKLAAEEKENICCT